MASGYQWSTWHPWNIVNDPDFDRQYGIRGMERDFWSLTEPFGSCLGASTSILSRLQGKIAGDTDSMIRRYANYVQLMTSAKHATSDNNHHAVVAMCFNDFAIVIDHALHPVAFKVVLGSTFNMAPYIPLFGKPGRERFKYFMEDGKFKLTMNNEKGSYPTLFFSGMDADKAVNQLTIPAAEEKQSIKGREHTLMPPRKYLSIRSLLDRKPQAIHAVHVDDKWLATTVRIQVNFEKTEISMQVPNLDWLLQLQGEAWHQKLYTAEGIGINFRAAVRERPTKETVLLTLPLNAQIQEYPNPDELRGITLLQSLAYEFGLENDVLNQMMHSVYRVWAPYRSKRADSIVEVERADAPVEDEPNSSVNS
ncbi:hypothetical protein N0V86_007644 [Didymella sp. IMI 355093]|nr:hypothetical protein N0V86_007644 [Didymella sp. IMI 355093]